MTVIFCQGCKKKPEFLGKIGFREECPYCQADLHICLNCRFYDESAYNECKESSAERVSDKQKNNYCEYFEPLCGRTEKGMPASNRAELWKTASALFKKDID